MLLFIIQKVVLLIQLILVITYILFEELIWEGIAKPIYRAIHALNILQRLEVKLEGVSPFMVLVIFMLLFVIVEALGLYAGLLFVSGEIFLGLVLYLSKIPIAAFTFWLFRVTEDTLMQFGWFKWLYDWIIRVVERVKSSEIHQRMMAHLVRVKGSVKESIKRVKERYFTGNTPFRKKIEQLYNTLKASLRK